MTLIRHRQPTTTRVLPHQANRRFFLGNQADGLPPAPSAGTPLYVDPSPHTVLSLLFSEPVAFVGAAIDGWSVTEDGNDANLQSVTLEPDDVTVNLVILEPISPGEQALVIFAGPPAGRWHSIATGLSVPAFTLLYPVAVP